MSFVKLLSQKEGCYHINPKKTNNMKNVVSVEDFAVAMMDELEQEKHHKERFTIGY